MIGFISKVEQELLGLVDSGNGFGLVTLTLARR